MMAPRTMLGAVNCEVHAVRWSQDKILAGGPVAKNQNGHSKQLTRAPKYGKGVRRSNASRQRSSARYRLSFASAHAWLRRDILAELRRCRRDVALGHGNTTARSVSRSSSETRVQATRRSTAISRFAHSERLLLNRTSTERRFATQFPG